MQLFKDGISGGGPLERLAVCVVRRDEVIDALHELLTTQLLEIVGGAAWGVGGGRWASEPLDLTLTVADLQIAGRNISGTLQETVAVSLRTVGPTDPRGRNTARVFADRCVAGLEANRERCEALVEQSLAMCTSLAPLIGYDKAADIAKESFKTGKTVRQIAIERRLISDADLNRALDPRRMTQPQADMIGSGGG